MNILIKNTTIVDKRSKFNNSNVDILIIDGIITEIKKNLILDKRNSKIKVIDIKNCHVSPGWFDFHVNFCDPGFENRDSRFRLPLDWVVPQLKPRVREWRHQ